MKIKNTWSWWKNQITVLLIFKFEILFNVCQLDIVSGISFCLVNLWLDPHVAFVFNNVGFFCERLEGNTNFIKFLKVQCYDLKIETKRQSSIFSD